MTWAPAVVLGVGRVCGPPGPTPQRVSTCPCTGLAGAQAETGAGGQLPEALRGSWQGPPGQRVPGLGAQRGWGQHTCQEHGGELQRKARPLPCQGRL